jgi:pimeloyl-ACP methyl ester carboxylesterase
MDQREVREQVKNIEQPVLILHPLHDHYVSLAVAEENHRILPQSYLATNEGPHQEIL